MVRQNIQETVEKLTPPEQCQAILERNVDHKLPQTHSPIQSHVLTEVIASCAILKQQRKFQAANELS